jgi:hypothetical protein
MASLPQRILAEVAIAAGLTDRMLADRLIGAGAPQQGVNQACRALERGGRIERRARPDGRVGIFCSGRGPPLPETPAASLSTADSMLSEDDVKRLLAAWLSANGWTTEIAWGKAPGIDIVARRGNDVWVIEAKGCGSRPEMRVNYFIGMLGETLQRMRLPEARYSIAMPDLLQFRRLWQRLNIMPCRNFAHPRTTLMRLGDNPQLLFRSPATATLPPRDDLYPTIRHRLTLDLTARFKVTTSAHSPMSEQGGRHRTLTPLASRLRKESR